MTAPLNTQKHPSLDSAGDALAPAKRLASLMRTTEAPLSILIIEPAGGWLHREKLCWSAKRVSFCECPQDGLAKVAAHQPSVVLIALHQQDSNGLRLARAVRDQLGSKTLIVVYGDLTQAQLRAFSVNRVAIRRKWGVDDVFEGRPGGQQLVAIIERLRSQQQRRMAKYLSEEPVASDDSKTFREQAREQMIQKLLRDAAASVSEPCSTGSDHFSADGLVGRFRGFFQ